MKSASWSSPDPNTREISKVAIGQGMRTLRMVALDRVRDGVSTLEQVLMLTAAH